MSEEQINIANDIAIIGMSGRFPGANTVAEFWENLCNGDEAIHFFNEQELLAAGVDPALLQRPDYVRAAPLLANIEQFDAAFFAIPPREAELMDPQQRLFLECAWEAMEHAGYDSDRAYERVGLFAGAGTNAYLLLHLVTNREIMEKEDLFKVALLNEKDHLAMRTSYKLKLNGPSINVNTACSTSSVAIHLGVQSLLSGECDMALAGGVSIKIPHQAGYLYQEGGIVSADGHCRVFDQQASGSIRSSGAGVVLLKRMGDALRDQDSIYAVIKGSAVNNDGSAKMGYTAPGIEGQSNVIVEAQGLAGISPEMVTYIEAHGTGTVLGDPIEMEALTRAFRLGTEKTGYCAIGSLKSNIGHLDAASGVAGVIKTAMALWHKQIPPSLHFTQPNAQIDFAHSPFYVNTQLAPWKDAAYPRTAGVSSFGIGGTNTHILLQEAPSTPPPTESKPWQVVILSARTPTALETASSNLARHLSQTPNLLLDDVAYTLQMGRKQFMQRRAIVCQDVQGTIDALTTLDSPYSTTGTASASPGDVVFLFPGQGSQYVQMAAELYAHEPIFRDIVDDCAAQFQPHLQVDLRACIYPDRATQDVSKASDLLKQTFITQAALFTIEYALAQLWMAWGVVPKALMGHSIGEYVAACLAGVFSLEDAIRLVAMRGKLIQSLPAGEMLAVSLSADEVRPLLTAQLAIAASNTPFRCVVSGSSEAMHTLQEQLIEQGIAHQRLHTSHAFHSPMMEPVRVAFMEEVKKVQRNPPTIPFISNVTGEWITTVEAIDAAYWARHLCQTVRFAEGIQLLCEQSQRIFLEVGPGTNLSTLVRQHPASTVTHQIIASLPHARKPVSDLAHILHALGQLWVCGVAIDWAGHDYYGQRRIALPTYPFERQRYWIAAPQISTIQQKTKNVSSSASMLIDQQGVQVSMSPLYETMPDNQTERWKNIVVSLKAIFGRLLGIDLTISDDSSSFLEIGADSLLLLQVSKIIQDEFGQKIPFRLLFETYTTFGELATYLDQILPAEPEIMPPTIQVASREETVGEPVVGAVDGSAGRGASLPPPASQAASREEIVQGRDPVLPRPRLIDPQPAIQSGLELIVEQQIQLMAQQLHLLQTSYGTPSTGDHHAPPVGEIAPMSAPVPARAASVPTEPAIAPHRETPSDQPVRSMKLDPEIFVPYRPRKVERIKYLSARQQEHIASLIQRFGERTQRSKELAQQYRPFLADNRGTAGFNFTFKEIVYPLVVERAEEAHVWDVDKNRYIDITMGFGALLFGHTPDFISQSLTTQIQQGMRLGWQSNKVGEAAQLLCEMTGVERVGFCNSGTEAVMTALRLARAVTGKSKIAVFAGAFHGTFDGVLVRGEETANGELHTIALAPGIPEHMIEDVIIVHFGRSESLEVLKRHATELAAVLVELPQSRRPDLVPNQFLNDLRQFTEASDIALIFDEVVAGFRTHPGGAQALVGIKADIVTYGKALGGGLPVAAVGGKAKYLDAIDGGMWSYGDASYPVANQTFYAGTHFRHPLLMPMVCAILTHLKNSGPQLQERLNQRTAQLVQALDNYFEEASVPIRMGSFGSLFRFVFPTEYKTVTANVFYYHLLLKGIYISETRGCFLSTAHTDEDVAAIIKAVRETIQELRAAGFFEPLPPDPAREPIQLSTSHISIMNGECSLENGARNGASSSLLQVVDNSVAATSPVLPQVASNKRPELSLVPSRTMPLTEQQKELWIVSQLAPEASRVYNESLQLCFQGVFHAAAMRQAIQKLVIRHEALRTTFSPEGDMQTVLPSLMIDIGWHDLSALDSERQAEQLARISMQEVGSPFDLQAGPLLRAALVKIGDLEHRLFFTVHHLVADGWSVGTLLHELQALYQAQASGTIVPLPTPMQYSEYIQWQTRQEGLLAEAQAYWLHLYADGLPEMSLPTDYPQPAVKTFRGAEQVMQIDEELYQHLKRLAKEQNCTLFVVLLAAYSLLLARLSAQTEIVIMIPTAGQLLAEAESLVGHCVNILPLRIQIDRATTVSALLQHVRQALLDAYPHQLYPMSNLVAELHPARTSHDIPFGGILFNLDQLETLSFAGLETSIAKNATESANFNLSLHVIQTETTLSLECGYNLDLFTTQTIRRWLHHMTVVLRECVEQPNQSLMQVSLLDAEERERMLMAWGNGHPQGMPVHTDAFAHTLFEIQAAKQPDSVAVVADDHYVTYGTLNAQANQLAHYLRVLGAGPEMRIGLCIERSHALVLGMLGILKAGAAHVSLDPSYPQERLAFVVADAQVPLILTQQHMQGCLPTSNTRLICLDTCWQDIAAESTENCTCEVGEENAAYVLYTSGSTGQPKGVIIPHRGLTNLLYWKQAAYGLTSADRMVFNSSISFDSFTYQVYLPLYCGAHFCIVPQEKEQDHIYTAELIKRQSTTYMSSVPALLNIYIEEHILEDCPSLRIIGCGGDAMTEQICRYFISHPQQTLWNMYGPTEATINTTYWRCNGAEMQPNPPIGRPIANLQVYLLDPWLQPVPVGIPGELHIGGMGLARGYLHLPALTAEKFIPDPFAAQPGARLYKTGDLACYLPDGNIQFLGRGDQQVKVRGVRIELGEIEAVLRKHPDIQSALVLLHKDLPGDNSLIAYVVQRQDQVVSSLELRAWLGERLPTTMLPAGYVVLADWPLLPSGKVDQQALLTMAYEQTDRPATWVAPRTPMENLLAGIWCEVLTMERVGVFDNFFELGGHSLLAMRVLTRIRKEIAVDLPFRTLFELPTIARLAERLEETRKNTALTLPPLIVQESFLTKQAPLSFAQKRLWVLYQLEPDSPFYNIPLILQAHGLLNREALEQALMEIVQRHEILRTIFVVEGGQPVQRVLAASIASIASTDLRAVDDLHIDEHIRQHMQAEVLRPFKLEQGPLLRCHILQVSQQKQVLIFTFHHSIFDGGSTAIFLRELSILYTAFSQQQSTPLLPLPVQYRDYALWQQRWLQGKVLDDLLAFWHKQLAGVPSVLHLPTDYPRPAVQTFQGDVYSFQLSHTRTQQIKSVSQRAGVTLFTTLLAAFGILLSRSSQQKDLLIGSPIANRSVLELESLIGVFMNTLVLRIDLSDNPTFRTLLKRVRAMLLDTYTYQDLPFEMLIDSLHLKRDLSHNPLVQVMFLLEENAPQTTLELGDLTIQPRAVEGAIAKFDLTLSMVASEDGLAGVWEYSTDLFTPETIRHYSDHFQFLLSALVSEPERTIEQIPLFTIQEKQTALHPSGEISNETGVGAAPRVRPRTPRESAWEMVARGHTGAREVPPLPPIHPQGGRPKQTEQARYGIHTLFEEQAARTPHAFAAVYGDSTLSYQQLNRQANRLAHHLRALGVGPEQRVGIYMERSLELLVAIMATLKAGGAFVPLDPHYPQERLQHLLTDAQPLVVLTHKGHAQPFLTAINPDAINRVPTVGVDAPGEYLDDGMEDLDANIQSGVQADNLAYMIYTSGSTGKPKGVMIPHGAAVNYLDWCRKRYLIASTSNVPVHSSISFDLTITSIFAPLQSGQCLHLLDEEQRGEALGMAIGQGASYDFVKLTPAHLDLLARHVGEEKLGTVAQTLIVGGEALYETHIHLWRSHAPNIRIINEYGPTETTVGCCIYTVAGDIEGRDEEIGGSVPIGKPIDNMHLYVLDKHMRRVPIGMPGEIYIGGLGVGRGYWNRPEQTAAVFVPDPFGRGTGERLYKTGDSGYWRADGNLIYVGRLDQQVKIRGFRIEPGEIEAVLRNHPQIQECIVDVRADDLHGKRLIAYIVQDVTYALTLTAQDIRAWLKDRLPEYMLPSAYMVLNALPLTPNGKIDRQALPDPTIAQSSAVNALVTPVGPVEKLLIEVWSQVLGLAHVGIHDNFFELGGDSIVGMLMVLKARDAGLELTSKQLFLHQTIAELAAHTRMSTTQSQGEVQVKGPVQLTPIQQWFFARELSTRQHWNQSIMLDVQPQIDFALLHECLQMVFATHDALHMRFTLHDGQMQQLQAQERSVSVEHHDLQNISLQEQDVVVSQIANEVQASLNLATGPLFRCVFFDLGVSKPAKLLLVVHHLAVDIVSWQILLADLHTVCQQSLHHQTLQLPPRTTSYQAWAMQLAAYTQTAKLQQEATYWLSLAWNAVRPLPIDYPGGRNSEASARTLTVNLSMEESQALLRDIPKELRVQVYEILTAALAFALAQWTENPVQLIEIERHGREDIQPDIDLSRTVGWFTALVPLCLNLSGQQRLVDVLKVVKEQVRIPADGGIGYALLRHLSEDVEIKRRFAALPTADIVFNYEGQSAQVLADTFFTSTSTSGNMLERALDGMRTHLLALNVSFRQGCLCVELTYSENIHMERTITNLLNTYIELLRSLLVRGQAVGVHSSIPSDFPVARLRQEQLTKLLVTLQQEEQDDNEDDY